MLNRILKTCRPARSVMMCAMLAFAGPALADSLQRGNLPMVEGITLIGVEEGNLVYRTGAGDRKVALADVNEIAIDAVPQFAAGLAEFKKGSMRGAEKAFEDVWSGARADWVKHFGGYYLVQVYDARGQFVEASQIYARLAAENADVFFMSKPPLKSLAEADDNQKERVGNEILAVSKTATGERRLLLQQFLKRVVGEGGPSLPPDTATNPGTVGGGAGQSELQANAKVLLPSHLWKILDRRGEPKDKWAAVEMLSKGEYQAAHDAIQPWLSNPGDLAEKLFIYGKAQLGLAEANNDQDMYRSAGLTFMRIVVHFNRAGQPHPLVTPARLEVAYIHKQIGREDIFDRILFGEGGGGGLNLVIDDAKAFPYYRKRYYDVIGEKPPDDQP